MPELMVDDALRKAYRGLHASSVRVHEPNDVQIQSTAWRVKDHNHYRRKYRPNYFVVRLLIVLAVVALVVLVGMEINK